ncbi:MAG: patatin [Bacteroidetes bacterium]|nr:MAG: patatin [Bacteroidota bacterium]
MAKPFLILSLDGGGLRGIVPTMILMQIEQITGKKIQDMFQLMAGTSTGGLIALGLSIGKTPAQLKDIYVQNGKKIFPATGGGITGLLHKAEQLFEPKYSPAGLQSVLDQYFGNTTMADCKVPVIACCYDLASNTPLFFKSRYTKQAQPINAKLTEVCRATSAAPTYFPAFRMSYNNMDRVCIDGGVYINNPGMAAFSEICKYYKDPLYNLPPDFNPDVNVFMLSLGTGTYTANLAQKKWIDGGLVNWATKISDIMMQATNQSTVYECSEMLPANQYYRMNISIGDDKYSDMADSSDATRNYLEQQVQAQIFNNAQVMKDLQAFLVRAGVMPAGSISKLTP